MKNKNTIRSKKQIKHLTSQTFGNQTQLDKWFKTQKFKTDKNYRYRKTREKYKIWICKYSRKKFEKPMQKWNRFNYQRTKCEVNPASGGIRRSEVILLWIKKQVNVYCSKNECKNLDGHPFTSSFWPCMANHIAFRNM